MPPVSINEKNRDLEEINVKPGLLDENWTLITRNGDFLKTIMRNGMFLNDKVEYKIRYIKFSIQKIGKILWVTFFYVDGFVQRQQLLAKCQFKSKKSLTILPIILKTLQQNWLNWLKIFFSL